MTDYSILSNDTRRCVTRAYKISRQKLYPAIPPLAMTIAIAEEARDDLAGLLHDMGLEMSAFRTALASALPVPGHNGTVSVPISEELDRCLDLAATLAQEAGEEEVRPVHVFQVLATNPGETRDVLFSMGASERRILRAFTLGRGTASSPVPKSLEKYTVELTQSALEGRLEPVIGRDGEIQRVIQVLLRKTKNNPVLVGPAGTGKTAIAEGLAQRIVNGDVPQELEGVRLFSLDIPALIAGAGVQGEFEDRIKQVMKDIKEHGDFVLFIDEIHLLIGTGGHGGAMDAANILKPALSRGEIRVIGATTTEEYTKYIESDKAFARRFQKVSVEEPDKDTSIAILQGIKQRYEAFHGITIQDDAVRAAVTLSMRYLNDRCLPDKAIDLLDEASSRLKMDQARDKVLTEDDIRCAVTALTGIPLSKIQDDDKERLAALEETLAARIIGQAEAVSAVSAVIRRNKFGFGDQERPIGSFLFLGPTGVGKTALAKALADYLFTSPDRMVRIDMSEYQQEHTVSRLFGAPPGYIGYDQGGQLTEAIRQHPFSVILLDEIEKAHPRVFETLLQVLDDGRMTDGQGRTVNFRNTIIILTSNLTEQRLKAVMRPEFLNRIDDIIVFRSLGERDVLSICRLQLESLKNKLAACGILLRYDDAALNLLCRRGFSPEYGARAIKRTLNHFVVDGIASALLRGELSQEKPIKVTAQNGVFLFTNSQ